MFIVRTIEKIVFRTKNVRCFSSFDSSLDNPVVAVKQGKLKGSVQKCLDGSPYFSFKGIPYAQPPVGELRFKAPLPAKEWIGIRDAIEHGPMCPQFDMTTASFIEGNEDCLSLNVYTKSLQPSSKIPVMVYIHGGAFFSGSGNSGTYGPEYFLQHDVILVTINYRLEALGFLCLDTPEVPGNAGMKDQVVALRWVKENISKFGGDPDNVTIFGESAGGAAVTYHLLSPMSKGLFNRAIVQSGVCLSYWTIAHQPAERAFRAGKILGKDTKNVNELLEYLRKLPVMDLPTIGMKTRTKDEKLRGLPIYFTPTVEKKFDGQEQFLTEDPMDMLLAGKVHKVPLLIGYNSAEGILMVGDHVKKIDTMNKDPSHLVPRDIATKVSADKLKEFGARLKKFYTGDKDFTAENAQANVDLLTDIHFSYQTHRFSNFYQALAPTYMYRFNYSTELNLFKKVLGMADVNGAGHAEDLFYLFRNDATHNYYEQNENLRNIIYQLTKLWVDFARTGNPTPTKEPIDWQPYTAATKQCLVLDQDMKLASYADKERMEFWNKMYADAGMPCMIKSNI